MRAKGHREFDVMIMNCVIQTDRQTDTLCCQSQFSLDDEETYDATTDSVTV